MLNAVALQNQGPSNKGPSSKNKTGPLPKPSIYGIVTYVRGIHKELYMYNPLQNVKLCLAITAITAAVTIPIPWMVNKLCGPSSPIGSLQSLLPPRARLPAPSRPSVERSTFEAWTVRLPGPTPPERSAAFLPRWPLSPFRTRLVRTVGARVPPWRVATGRVQAVRSGPASAQDARNWKRETTATRRGRKKRTNDSWTTRTTRTDAFEWMIWSAYYI